MGNCRSKIWAQHFSGGGKTKLDDDHDNDGLGRGLLAGDESESQNFEDGAPSPKKAFDYYGGNFLTPLEGEDEDDDEAEPVTEKAPKKKKKKAPPAL
mmetsp:Transcript_67187/g.101272  ORF Transcript_67187/g.101272 Transcript_67187/m.101272 type:complete len:97 (-) Transcript_67187:79-369(-)